MNKIDKVILLAEKLGVKEEWLHDKTIQFLTLAESEEN